MIGATFAAGPPNIPIADALFLTPRMSQTFRWYASRGEVVNWKDIPQDAKGIVEWWRRLGEIWGVGTRRRPDRIARIASARSG